MSYGESYLTPIRTPLCQIDRARNLYRVRRMIFSRYIGDVAAALGLILFKNMMGVREGRCDIFRRIETREEDMVSIVKPRIREDRAGKCKNIIRYTDNK